MTVGERIRNRRIQLGMSQEELALKMGYSGKSTICKAETGGDNVTTDKVKKYADALSCSFSYLMGWEDKTDEDDRYNHFTKEDEGIVADFIMDKIKNKYIRLLYETLGDITEDEGKELIRYAQFIKSQRTDSKFDFIYDNKDIGQITIEFRKEKE